MNTPRRVVVLPLVMVLLAAFHGWRVEMYGENPWVGAGFGMFATVDGPQRTIVVDETSGETIVFPGSITPETNRASNFPSPSELARLAEHLEVEEGLDIASLRVERPLFGQGRTVAWEEVAGLDVP
jgi:hypothetical protein